MRSLFQSLLALTTPTLGEQMVIIFQLELPYYIPRPTLINNLLENVDTILQKRYISMAEDAGETLKLRRSLKLLNGILKEFASAKLPNGIKAMAQVPSFPCMCVRLTHRSTDCWATTRSPLWILLKNVYDFLTK